MFPCLFAKNVHMLIETATGHHGSLENNFSREVEQERSGRSLAESEAGTFNLKQSLSEFAEWTLQMPAGITRNRTDVHEWMIRVLNTCEEKSMDASTVAILLQLWGFPGDDVPHELNSISVDISYNFNRLNQQLWAPPTGFFLKSLAKSSGEVEQERSGNEQNPSCSDSSSSSSLSSDSDSSHLSVPFC